MVHAFVAIVLLKVVIIPQQPSHPLDIKRKSLEIQEIISLLLN